MRKSITSAAALLGKKGGKSKSEAKVSAARDNGKKGGRPPKTKAVEEAEEPPFNLPDIPEDHNGCCGSCHTYPCSCDEANAR